MSTDLFKRRKKLGGILLEANYLCKECNQYVMEGEYYFQGKVCKICRNKKINNKIKSLSGNELAEHLLHKSCIRVMERVRDEEKVAYKGVKCEWDKPWKMKEELMKRNDFWDKWVMLTEIYEDNGRLLKLRPTIDRIESNVEKGGHYIMGNLQVLSYSENTFKAKSIKCKVIFIKNLKVVKVTSYESIKDIMKELEIPAYNTLNIIINSGEIYNVGNGYTILIQTLDGMLKKQESPVYKAVVNKQTILVDYLTNKEYIIKNEFINFDSYGIWFENEFQPITINK